MSAQFPTTAKVEYIHSVHQKPKLRERSNRWAPNFLQARHNPSKPKAFE